MQHYKNYNGNSGILRYEIGDNFVTVEFQTGNYRFYKYTFMSAGQSNVNQMKTLAIQGRGLNGFIKEEIGDDYEIRW